MHCLRTPASRVGLLPPLRSRLARTHTHIQARRGLGPVRHLPFSAHESLSVTDPIFFRVEIRPVLIPCTLNRGVQWESLLSPPASAEVGVQCNLSEQPTAGVFEPTDLNYRLMTTIEVLETKNQCLKLQLKTFECVDYKGKNSDLTIHQYDYVLLGDLNVDAMDSNDSSTKRLVDLLKFWP
ncbi:hypothetical protein J6590_005306 [Homalodisca vitripennis]|nr:hypothetical protein J6590_005306 [Homalodisca vitripennis]